jgi:hypothetical protein
MQLRGSIARQPAFRRHLSEAAAGGLGDRVDEALGVGVLRVGDDLERGDRLVADQEPWPRDEGACEVEPLALPAGQLVRVDVVVLALQADHGEALEGALAPCGGVALPGDHEGLLEDAAHPVTRVECRRRVLEHQLDLAAQGLALPVGEPHELLAPVQDAPGVWALEAQDQPARGGLARPGLPHQPVDLDNDTLRRILGNEDALKALMSIEGFRNLNQDIETIINRSEAIKKAKREREDLTSREKKEMSAEETELKSRRKQIQEKLIKFATRIPVFMYLTDYREQTLKDVITQLEPGLFKKVTGLTVKDFELLVSLGVFNDALMNDAVYKFRRYEDSSLTYAGVNRHEGERVGLFDTTLSDFEYMAKAQEESMVAPNGLLKRGTNTGIGPTDSKSSAATAQSARDQEVPHASPATVSVGVTPLMQGTKERRDLIDDELDDSGLDYRDERPNDGYLGSSTSKVPLASSRGSTAKVPASNRVAAVVRRQTGDPPGGSRATPRRTLASRTLPS